MSGKVLATIAQVLTDDVIDAMADRAKMDRASARKAAELGVPALLTALTKLVARSSGVARLRRALAGQSTSPGPVPDGGGDGMSLVLSGEDAGALASAIGRFVGAPEGSAHDFLDELTSMILRTLARQGETPTAGGKGVANLLTAEKDLIAAAMPAGLVSLLCANSPHSRPGMGVSTIGAAAGTPIYHPAMGAMGAMGAVTASPDRRRPAASRAYWAVLLIALAAVAWYLLAAESKPTGGGSDVVVSTVPAPNAPLDAHYQKTDVDNRAGATIGTLTDALGGPGGIARALVSLGGFLGFGEESSATPLARQNGGDERLVRTTERDDPRSRQHLRFVSPDFRDVVRPPLPTAVDTPTRPTIAAH